ncbi:MAG: hypothetical protein ABR499_02190 [Gemmatimonadaceae bacterium]
MAVVAGGCFAYRATEPARVAPGQLVRVTLTPSGAQELTQQVGPRVEALDGRVLQARDSAFSVAVTQLSRARAGEEFWTGDSVVVPFRGVSSLWVRRLDRKRSAMAVGGTIIAVFAMRRVVQEAGLFGGGPGRPPGSQ